MRTCSLGHSGEKYKQLHAVVFINMDFQRNIVRLLEMPD